MSENEYRGLAELRFQIRRFLRFSEQASREARLEPQHHQALLAIKGLPEGKQATIGELAERMQLRHHSAVELIDRMAARRLVRRSRNLEDRRMVVVSITPRGERILHELSLSHREELRRLGPDLLHALQTLMSEDGR